MSSMVLKLPWETACDTAFPDCSSVLDLCHAPSLWISQSIMTEVLPADINGITRAATLLRGGALVAFGTETVYGLGADATGDRAVASIFAAKDRPRFNPLICHYASAEAAFVDVVANNDAHRLAAAFWPGPLTLVLPRVAGSRVSLLASAGLDTIAVRVPAHNVALALLRECARPIAAPSANRSGKVSPTTARHVMTELTGRIAAVLDSGPCPIGLESTVLDLSDAPTLLRPGGATVEAIEAVIGPLRRVDHAAPTSMSRSPGMLVSHYAPRLPMRLDAHSVQYDEALLSFGAPLKGSAIAFDLSTGGDLTEAAARLFDGLRRLDEAAASRGLVRIAVMPVPHHGLGLAINDRLRRAAAPRA
jgi:L-threonylcarbamoyladenylate synthase